MSWRYGSVAPEEHFMISEENRILKSNIWSLKIIRRELILFLGERKVVNKLESKRKRDRNRAERINAVQVAERVGQGLQNEQLQYIRHACI